MIVYGKAWADNQQLHHMRGFPTGLMDAFHRIILVLSPVSHGWGNMRN